MVQMWCLTFRVPGRHWLRGERPQGVVCMGGQCLGCVAWGFMFPVHSLNFSTAGGSSLCFGAGTDAAMTSQTTGLAFSPCSVL